MARKAHEFSSVRLAGSLAVGVVAAVVAGITWAPRFTLCVGWTVASATFCIWTWGLLRQMTGRETQRHSQREEPGIGWTRTILLVASLASLVGVGMLLIAGSHKGATGYAEAGVGALSVLGSWFVIHVMYMLHYAREYYGEGHRGIEFINDDEPDYYDFAYLSFCLGMTYQVSDTNIKDRLIRRTVMRHTLLSYFLGAVVVASTINLVVQLASSQG